MLAQEVVKAYGERARFAIQDFGSSPLAKRFGIDKYPAVFVDDALVARPEDFYVWGHPERGGKYVPFTELTNRRKFQTDLRHLVDLRLSGAAIVPTTEPATKISQATAPPQRLLPDTPLTALDGTTFRFADLRGKPVIVEFWATWCPICLETLKWMKTELGASDATVVAVTVDSERKDVDAILARLRPRARVIVASDELRHLFDGPPAVPTMIVADREGRIVKTYYGAPPTLHQELKKELARLR